MPHPTVLVSFPSEPDCNITVRVIRVIKVRVSIVRLSSISSNSFQFSEKSWMQV